jgi:hypothetical protein
LGFPTITTGPTPAGGGAQPTTGLPTGTASKILALTGTVQYDLWKNVLTRAELRWDHALDGRDAFGGTSATGINGPGTQKDSFELIANVVYKF